MTDFAIARQHMIDGQIRPNKVIDPAVLDAIASTPREVFVPQARRHLAYMDENVVIADQRYLMEPTVFARLIQALTLSPDDVVIDIGGMTGYAAVVLSKLSARVVMLESNPELAAQAKENFQKLVIKNIEIHLGDLADGCKSLAPFNAGFVNGAVSTIPNNWINQLSELGGRLGVVISHDRQVGRACLGEKNADNWSIIPLFDSATPYLAGFSPKPSFAF